ncbi:ABC transporter substrate-binding protein [Sporanaerobacter acetigenes]|uniref:Extracellular solute-binding protein, family 5 Middle n=1 Tax=Sporanaerobacter acetigenes DSM 13106 TaxID=1123281 RepID=A0A1M5Z9D1_9FIRM|nr:ABC transporter substrate-binding protein [Sporanaerobacter acetigenes]SHI20829.1 extracellular solute-binding protein, family 5 Middle [Sporanaerobacter acetigenes DSM 13106]
MVSVGNTINGVLFEGLIDEDENLEIQPAVAESWEISDDGLFYTFHLRKDAKWSDGEPVTTKNFEYSWKRALTPENAVKLANEFFYIKNAEACFNGEILPIKGDVKRAQAALAEAGYPNGEGFPKVEYLYNSSPGNKRTAEMLQEMWKNNLNIDIELVNVEYKVESERRHSGQFQLARSAWNGGRFPFSYLQIFETGNSNNNPQFSDPEYDALVKKIRTEIDIAKKNELLHEAEEFALKNYIVCPLTYGSSTLLLSNRVKDFRISPTGSITFHYVYIEE